MNETAERPIKEKAPLNKEVQLINLPAPTLLAVKKEFQALVGLEETLNQILQNFAEQYFQMIEEDALKKFPDIKIGFRTIIGNTTQENLKIEKLNRFRPVTAIKRILETGSDIKGLVTNVTEPNKEKVEKSNTGMSGYYLKTMIKEALNSKTNEVVPLVLVYDLDSTKKRSEFGVEFPDGETMKNSLLAVYFVDYNSLVAVFN